MSTWDFIEGFLDTQGDILDKIKGGIKNVIFRFIEFPVQLMGYLWNWIDRTFLGGSRGYQETADKFVAVWKKGLDGVFDFFSVNTFNKAWEGLKQVYSGFMDKMKDIWNGVTEKTKAFFDLFFDIPRKFGEFIDEQRSDFQAWWKNTWIGKRLATRITPEDMREVPKHTILPRKEEDYQAKWEADKSEGLLESIETTLKKLLFVNEEQLRSADKSIQLQNVVVNNDNSRAAGVFNAPPAHGPSELINAVNSAGGYR